MFYNALIEAFLPDETLFSDVKAIVDCPLKSDPATVVKACREVSCPRELLVYLDQPGSDLDHAPLPIPIECQQGRDGFLNCFNPSQLPVPSNNDRKSMILRSATRDDADDAEIQKPSLAETRLIRMVSRGAHLHHRQKVMEKMQRQNRLQEMPEIRRPLVRRSTASALWASRLADMVNEYNKNSAETHVQISEVTKYTVMAKYFLRLKRMGEEIIQLWPKFYRVISPNWAPDRNSLIPIPRPFIVPGGRFVENYYWDTYWILLGLLASGLFTQARETLENFLYCIERIGFIPNGLRKYYLDRSQPPVFSCMLRAYYHATGDLEFMREAMQMLEREYQWWMNPATGHTIELPYGGAHSDEVAILNRYYSLEVTPRPESYRIDHITGSLYKEHGGAADSLEEHFRAIRAGAESGWDFSSRWLRPAVEGQGQSGIKPDIRIDRVLHKVCLVDIDTCNILPCDLNAFLFCVEEDLTYFAKELGKLESQIYYSDAKERRRKAMLHFLWDRDREMWLDYDLKTHKLSHVISAASFVPLWAGVNPEILDDQRRIQLCSNLSCLIRQYGVVCTNVTAKLQWDSPNIWAPMHHIAVDFLAGGRFWDVHKDALFDQGPAVQLAAALASRFINTVLDRFEMLGSFAEKYDCVRLGKTGRDGEYVTQDGFGWTNGAVLDMLMKFKTKLTPAALYTPEKSNTGTILIPQML